MGNENRVGPFELLLNPDLADLFITQLRSLALSMRTHTMATVVTYNPATQRAVVLVDMLTVVNDITKNPNAANPNPEAVQNPIKLEDVPVAWPRTGRGYLTFPILPGDRGELHVQDRSIDSYIPAGLPGPPVIQWTHNLADAVFHPGIIHSTDPIVPATDLTATVLEGDTFIKFGALAADFILKGTTVQAAFTTWTAAVAAAGVVHAATVPATPVSNGVFIVALVTATSVLAGTIASWASLKVSTE